MYLNRNATGRQREENNSNNKIFCCRNSPFLAQQAIQSKRKTLCNYSNDKLFLDNNGQYLNLNYLYGSQLYLSNRLL